MVKAMVGVQLRSLVKAMLGQKVIVAVKTALGAKALVKVMIGVQSRVVVKALKEGKAVIMVGRKGNKTAWSQRGKHEVHAKTKDVALAWHAQRVDSSCSRACSYYSLLFIGHGILS